MNKLLITVVIIMAICVLGIGIYYSAGPEAAQPLPEKEIVDNIQTQYPGKVTNVSLAQDEGVPTYEAELTGETKKFALQLDASSGKVLDLKEKEKLSDDDKNKTSQEANSSDKDKSSSKSSDKHDNTQDKKEKFEKHGDQSDDKRQSEETDSKNSDGNNGQSSNQIKDEKENNPVISKREAVEKALEQFSGDVDDVDLEDEDGRLYYEIEIERGDLEAEVMIDAYTGEVLIIEIDD